MKKNIKPTEFCPKLQKLVGPSQTAVFSYRNILIPFILHVLCCKQWVAMVVIHFCRQAPLQPYSCWYLRHYGFGRPRWKYPDGRLKSYLLGCLTVTLILSSSYYWFSALKGQQSFWRSNSSFVWIVTLISVTVAFGDDMTNVINIYKKNLATL